MELLAEVERNPRAEGSVALVGAGPGDPGFLTLKALRTPQSADVVLYGRGGGPAMVDKARREAEKIASATRL